MLEHQNLRFTASDRNISEHASSFFSISKAHYESGQFSLCRFLKRGIEDWAHIKLHSGIVTREILDKFIGGLVYESKAYTKDSDTHPWHPGHTLGSVLWNHINHANEVISEHSEHSLILLNIFRTTKGFAGYNKLREIKFFEG